MEILVLAVNEIWLIIPGHSAPPSCILSIILKWFSTLYDQSYKAAKKNKFSSEILKHRQRNIFLHSFQIWMVQIYLQKKLIIYFST